MMLSIVAHLLIVVHSEMILLHIEHGKRILLPKALANQSPQQDHPFADPSTKWNDPLAIHYVFWKQKNTCLQKTEKYCKFCSIHSAHKSAVVKIFQCPMTQSVTLRRMYWISLWEVTINSTPKPNLFPVMRGSCVYTWSQIYYIPHPRTVTP